MAQIRALAGASGTGSEEERPAVVVRTGQRGMLPERRQDPMQVRSLADMVHRQLDLQPVAAEQPAGEQILLAEVQVEPGHRIVGRQEYVVNADQRARGQGGEDLREEHGCIATLEGAMAPVDKDEVLRGHTGEGRGRHIFKWAAHHVVADRIDFGARFGVNRQDASWQGMVADGSPCKSGGEARADLDEFGGVGTAPVAHRARWHPAPGRRD